MIRVLILVVIISVGMMGCSGLKKSVDESTKQHNKDMRGLRIRAVRENLEYIKDERTGNCFAVSYFDRSATMATVPCESIPLDLFEKPQ